MSNFRGKISKLNAELTNPICYYLPIGNQEVPLNQYFGKKVNIIFNGEIFCIHCNKKIKKTFMQGYCYPCFLTLPQTSECVFKPSLCRAHIGEARDMEWSQKH